MKNNLTEGEEVKRFEDVPTPTATQDRGAATLDKVSKEPSYQPANYAPSDSAVQPHIEYVEHATNGSVAKMPDKFDFYFKKDGAGKANKFFGSIRFNESLEQVLENAHALASDKVAVEEVLDRGPTERAYLIKAMRDLQVPLP